MDLKTAALFQFDKAYHDELRTSTGHAIGHRQERLDKAISETHSIRYSKLVHGLGPWAPFYLIRGNDKENDQTVGQEILEKYRFSPGWESPDQL